MIIYDFKKLIKETQDEQKWINQRNGWKSRIFICTVTEELKKGEKVTLVGFGTFGVSKRAARKGRNPRKANEIINIPAKKVAKFSAGSELKEAVK